MNRWQKIAWFNLIIAAVTVLASAAAIAMFIRMAGVGIGLLCGLSFGGIAVITVIAPLVFRVKGCPGEVVFDERDEQIRRMADKSSDCASLALFLIVCMGSLLVVGLSGTVPVSVLPLMVCWAYIAGKFAESATILSQYGWRNKNHE